MCNAKQEHKFRTYGGLVMNVGAVEMEVDSAMDVSRGICSTYNVNSGSFYTNTGICKDGTSDTKSVTGSYGPKTKDETVSIEFEKLLALVVLISLKNRLENKSFVVVGRSIDRCFR
jgi:hypothetical protein